MIKRIKNHIREKTALQRGLKSSSKSASFASLLTKLFSLVQANQNIKVLLGLNSHIGDMCFAFAFWDELKRRYGGEHLYLVCDEKWLWIPLCYGVPTDHVIAVESWLNYQLTNRLVFREYFSTPSFFFGSVFQKKTSLFRTRVLKDYSKVLFGTVAVSPTCFPSPRPLETKERVAVVNGLSLSATIENGIISECVSILKKHGVDIVFNQEIPDGMEGVVFSGDPLAFADLCTRSLTVISVRSGILDLAIRSISSCLCFYPDNSWWRCFSLSQWHTGTDLVEITAKKWRRLKRDQKEKIISRLIRGAR